MNANQILTVCMIKLLEQDEITGYKVEEISDEEAALILRLISEGEHHLDYRQHTCGSKTGKFYPWPAAHCNAIYCDSSTYTELCRLWSITK
jgi:hypothetical protein